MVRAPTKSCPNLFKVLTEAPADLVSQFLSAKAFQKMDWLDTYRFDPADRAGLSQAARMLFAELKSNLSPLESEGARITKIAGPSGQLALDGIVLDQQDEEIRSDFAKGQDELGRSLWFYTSHYRLFEAAENALHLRLYRRYDRHYQTFLAVPTGSDGREMGSSVLTSFLDDLEQQLDRGKGTSIDRFDLAEEGGEPPAEMYLIRHPKLSTSAREIDENGQVSKFYFRPPGEAMVVFIPSTGRIHVRADTRAIRHLVRQCFVSKALGQDLSHEPTDFQAYDVSRFLTNLNLPVPDDPDVLVKSVSVIRLEASIGKLSNRLTLSAAIQDGVQGLISAHPSLAGVLSNAVAVRFVEIAVRFRRSGRENDETLDFTISDRNTSSLLSLDDPFERVLGHRLLRKWEILVDGRSPGAQDLRLVLPVILALWDSGVDRVTGAWLVERKIDASIAVDLGFLVPMGWEDIDLVEADEGANPQEAAIDVSPGGVVLDLAAGSPTPGGDPENYRLYRVREEWVAQYLKSDVVRQFGSSIVEAITPNLLALGDVDVDSVRVSVYLARRLNDEQSHADIDSALRLRSNGSTGLVLNAGRRIGFSFGKNVLLSLCDHLAEASLDDTKSPVIDMDSLKSAFLRHRNLAQGGEMVELVLTGEHHGTLCVPGGGTIDITGESRIAIIERLVANHRKTGLPMKTEDLTKGMGGQSLSNIFGKELWRKLKATFLRTPRKGSWEIAA